MTGILQAPGPGPAAPESGEAGHDPAAAVTDAPLAAALPGIMTCVHCGFCLQACPTYRALGDENDSPRGRVLLMRSVVEGTLPLTDPSFQTHIDRCLGCRACETACPSGVPYGQLLEAARATMVEAGRPLPWIARWILFVFARPALLGVAMLGARALRATRLPALLARMRNRVGFSMAMLDATRPALAARPYTRRTTSTRGTVALLEGCVMRGLFASTNGATRRTLRANGYRPVDAPRQGCCGALHAHAGDAAGARTLARRNIEAFEQSGADVVVVNAAGCGAFMKAYGHLLVNDPAWAARAAVLAARTRDVTELLGAAGPVRGGTLRVRVTYDAPCHLLHGQRVVGPPLEVLAAVPGVELVPLAEADQCCGGAGIYNLVEPETSGRVLATKVGHIAATGAALVVTGNPGCHMQIGAGLAQIGLGVRVVHPVDILDRSYAAGWHP